MLNLKSNSIKDSILMPPPIIHSLSILSKSDTSEELKKNLRISSKDDYMNKKIHMKLLEELNNDDNSDMSPISIPPFLQKSYSILKKNGTNTDNLSEDVNNQPDHLILRMNPRASNEIILYVENLFTLLSKYLHINKEKFSKMMIELETRYKDYCSNALKSEYFKETIVKMQEKVLQILQSNLNIKTITYLEYIDESNKKKSNSSNSIVVCNRNLNGNGNLSNMYKYSSYVNTSGSVNKEGKESKENKEKDENFLHKKRSYINNSMSNNLFLKYSKPNNLNKSIHDEQIYDYLSVKNSIISNKESKESVFLSQSNEVKDIESCHPIRKNHMSHSHSRVCEVCNISLNSHGLYMKTTSSIGNKNSNVNIGRINYSPPIV